ncbi:hypothetical protein TNCV_4491881 [Trichonephila clavipes]|nr:hypothetical protein TNCV_4491881 [Trichonephila clavipes]
MFSVSKLQNRDEDLPTYCQHLTDLYADLNQRFEEIFHLDISDWVLNPFAHVQTQIPNTEEYILIQEQLIEISTNEEVQPMFEQGYHKFCFEHHARDSTSLLGSTPILRENTLGWLRAFHLSCPSTNLTRGLAARRLFKVSPCCKGTIHLQTSMPSPGLELRPYGTAVSVTNHYTGWRFSAIINLIIKKVRKKETDYKLVLVGNLRLLLTNIEQ